jgi:hypothetical protein
MVLCVVREGTGFFFSPNLKMIARSRTSTKSEIAVMIHTSQSWNVDTW